MTAELLEKTLSDLSKKRVELTINNNRSTMISILERKRRFLRLSLHQMFLKASNQEVEALVLLLKNRSTRDSNAVLRKYIQEHSSEVSATQRAVRLKPEGSCYNLLEMYCHLNDKYFNNQIDATITWFGNQKVRPKSQISFGLYQPSMRLIKIHRLLDSARIPAIFVQYIIFHEMLHQVHRPVKLPSGRNSIHTKSFKKHEKLFEDYQEAKRIEKQLKHQLFY